MCIIIWLQCKALFKFISWKKNKDEYFIQHMNIKKTSVFFICRYYHRICPSSFFCVCVKMFFFSTFLCVSFVFLCLCHTAFEKLYYYILFFICLLPFVYLSFFSRFHLQTSLSATCVFLVVCFGPWFCMCWPCFHWARVFVWVFFSFSIFLFFACSFFFPR